MSHKDFLWCGEGDLFSRPPLKTRKLYTPQSTKSSKSARRTKSSHTASHTGSPPTRNCQNRLRFTSPDSAVRDDQHVRGETVP
jgi:hypothetical protein